MAPTLNIDGYGRGHIRREVRAIQRNASKETKIAAAKERRARRAAARASAEAIVFYSWPEGGINSRAPDGAYIQGGPDYPGKRYQIVVVGNLKGPVEGYCRALSAWINVRYRIASAEPMPIAPAAVLLRPIERPFLNIILEPDEAT